MVPLVREIIPRAKGAFRMDHGLSGQNSLDRTSPQSQTGAVTLTSPTVGGSRQLCVEFGRNRDLARGPSGDVMLDHWEEKN